MIWKWLTGKRKRAESRYRIYETDDTLYFILENEKENNKLYSLTADHDAVTAEPEIYAALEQFVKRYGTERLLKNGGEMFSSCCLCEQAYEEYRKIRKRGVLVADEKRHYVKKMGSLAKQVFSERLFIYVFDERQIDPPPQMLAFSRGFLFVQATNALDADELLYSIYPEKVRGIRCYTERCIEKIWNERKKGIYKNMPLLRSRPITKETLT